MGEREAVVALPRCPKCGAGPVGNCGYYGCETPRESCPLKHRDHLKDIHNEG